MITASQGTHFTIATLQSRLVMHQGNLAVDPMQGSPSRLCKIGSCGLRHISIGTVELFIEAMQSQLANIELQALCCAALGNLASQNEERRLKVVSLGGTDLV